MPRAPQKVSRTLSGSSLICLTLKESGQVSQTNQGSAEVAVLQGNASGPDGERTTTKEFLAWMMSIGIPENSAKQHLAHVWMIATSGLTPLRAKVLAHSRTLALLEKVGKRGLAHAGVR